MVLAMAGKKEIPWSLAYVSLYFLTFFWEIYIVYWNYYAVFKYHRQLRKPLPLTHRRMMWA